MRAFFVIKLYVFCNARSECILGLEGLNEKGFSGSDVERDYMATEQVGKYVHDC